MNYLVVVAHPDDEVLGAGAFMYKLVSGGHSVSIAILCGHADARANLSNTLAADRDQALKVLGVNDVCEAFFPNIKMNTVPHLDLVQFVERCITESQADAMITHHPSDVNIDHQEVSKAVNAAARLFQRTTGVPRLKELLYMEVPSSTEWNLNSAQTGFSPNLFVEIGKDGVERKIEAISLYKGVMRPYPHPRSVEAITGLAAYRGSQAGVHYAEAFECVFRSI